MEEAPSPSLDAEQRSRICGLAAKGAAHVGYRNAGTMEFLLDQDSKFYFMEVNCRIQVEHGITEMVTGVDLVKQQLRVAAGEKLGITQEDMSVTGAVLVISTFGFWIALLGWLTWRSDRARRLVEGVPLVLVRDGEPVDAALAAERMPLAEVLEAARQQGIEDLDEVRLAVLEVNGRISIIQR